MGSRLSSAPQRQVKLNKEFCEWESETRAQFDLEKGSQRFLERNFEPGVVVLTFNSAQHLEVEAGGSHSSVYFLEERGDSITIPVRWDMPLFLALNRQEQEDLSEFEAQAHIEFEVSQGCTLDPVSKNKTVFCL